ncbi:LmbE-like protein [Fistulina hepatica ATCC 64428]|uniref:N-acetylglucosaminylphosphatidylinositol deacetylase n=1 Tax=Fistulina hepatica ATCC 64428 TaxID=1128425 RepID=A0A0D7ABV3_9AGAR|nr:LmbE-like protein [Fistulina hepatica ATCC 64428]
MFAASLWTLVFALIAAVLYFPASLEPVTFGPRTLLVVAHPDDECMFFAPTVLSLTNRGAEVHVISLSVGNANGLGSIRAAEFDASLDVLQVPSHRRRAFDHPNLQDNITDTWDAATIVEVTRPYVTAHNITTILTFDRRGVSSHPNHKSLSHGLKYMVETSALDVARPRLYSLISVPLGIKYLSILAPLQAHLDIYMSSLMGGSSPPNARMPLVFVSDVTRYLTALRAMRQHASQLVWFRWLFVLFSRYMWVNEWVELSAAV